jgi:4-diphosphocytidyl-2-C-methyl-D-erythritol kinase
MISLKAPAKINWFLKIDGKRSDGYHDIRTLMQKVSLYDLIELLPSEELVLESSLDVPVEKNLVYRSAILLRERYGVGTGALMRLRKVIPSGAGLGGGSSDAASVLLGLNTLWGLNLSREELAEAGAEIGSDVPFFIFGPAAFAHGRGEKIVPVSRPRKAHLLLVKPPVSVSTAWAYGRYSEAGSFTSRNGPELTKNDTKLNNIEFFIARYENAGIRDLAGVLSNDLETVTIERFPVIAEIKRRLLDRGAQFVLMTGSGPTVFGVFRDRTAAVEAAEDFPGHWTAAVDTLTD